MSSKDINEGAYEMTQKMTHLPIKDELYVSEELRQICVCVCMLQCKTVITINFSEETLEYLPLYTVVHVYI